MLVTQQLSCVALGGVDLGWTPAASPPLSNSSGMGMFLASVHLFPPFLGEMIATTSGGGCEDE